MTTLNICIFSSDSDSIDNNAVDPDQVNTFDVQEKRMNFLGDASDKPNLTGSPDMNLTAAILAHEASKNANFYPDLVGDKVKISQSARKPSNGHINGSVHSNGHIHGTPHANGEIQFDGLQTTEI